MDRRKLGKSRAGAASRDVKDTDRRTQQAIEKLVQKDVGAYLEDTPSWLEDLPSGQRADIIKAHLPRPKPIDQDLELQYLSMVKSLEVIPDMDDLTAELAVLRIEVDKYKALYEVTAKVSRYMERKDYEWVMPLVKDAFRRGREYKISQDELNLPDEQWKRILEYFMRKSKKERHERAKGKHDFKSRHTSYQGEAGPVPDEVEEVSSGVRDGGVPGEEAGTSDGESG